MPEDHPNLSKEEEEHADKVVSQVLMEQLDDAPWIKSEIPDVEIQKIVERSEKQSPNAFKYDYLPRVIFVPEDDFELW
ncbi:hypothetical protein BGZ97_009980, partial [Linnemannia gamsii]